MRALHHHAALVALLVLGTAGQVFAGDFQVEPTHLELARRGAATELTISNRGAVAIRFEAKVFVWHQDELGAMQLEPTTDVVVYPTLFAIEPGAARSIRIASSAPPGAVERTYRIFVEELPARVSKPAGGAPATIAVRARIGVPIYVAPIKSIVSGAIVGEVGSGGVRIAVENHGAVHVKVATVRVIGTDRAGKTVVDLTQPSWYVLAGGVRRHDLVLDRASCRSIAQLAFEAVTDHGTWRSTVAMPGDACSARP